MKIDEFVNKFLGLGLWGIIAAIILIIGVVVITLLVNRRNRSENTSGINWTQKIEFILSATLLLVSGAWSGLAKYNDYIQSNETQACIVAAGYIVCSIVVAVALQKFSTMVKREKNASRAIPILGMIVISLFWLCISPLQNARYLCEKEAVRSEIEISFDKLERYSRPFIAKYTMYRNKIVPQLAAIHQYLVTQAEEQSKPELGGCGKICRQFESAASMLEPSVNRLYMEFDPDDPAKDYSAISRKLQREIVHLINTKVLTSVEMQDVFYKKASRWIGIIDQALSVDSPALTLKQSLGALDSLLLFLQGYNAGTSIQLQAVSVALSNLEPLINDLKVVFSNENHSQLSQSVSYIDLSTKTAEFSMAEVAGIRMNVKMLQKHLEVVWPDVMLAFFVDLSAMAFIYIPMLIVMLRGRNIHLCMERIEKFKQQTGRLKATQTKLDHQSKRLESKKQVLIEKKSASLEGIDKKKDRARKTIDTHYLKDCIVVKKQNKGLLDSLAIQLEELKSKLHSAIQEASSPEEELIIRGKFELFKENTKAQYAEKLKKIDRRLEQLAMEKQARVEKSDDHFNKLRIKRRRSIERDVQRIDKELVQIDRKRQKCTDRLFSAEQYLTEAENLLVRARKDEAFYC